MSQGMKITNKGRDALALALTGQELIFTRVLIGDGTLANNADISSMTRLINQKKELPIVNINKTSAIGTAEIICEVSNQNLNTGFWVREFGLFAKAGANGQEILYSYNNVGNESSYLPAGGGSIAIDYVLSIITVIDQASNVTAIMQDSNKYVTSTMLTDKINSLFGAFKKIKGFWTYADGDSKMFRPAGVQDIKDIIIGQYDIDTLNARIKASEDAIGQILLSLELENLYPDYSLFLSEDFENTNEVDIYRCKVTSIVAGDDSIDCEPLDGIIPGSFYMLTDGISSELVQVNSISIENGVQRVILVNPVSNTYVLNTCMLYRTSANVLQGRAAGASASQSLTWNAGIVWKGSGANTSYEVSLDTSSRSSGNFEIEGTGGFNASGQATLQV